MKKWVLNLIAKLAGKYLSKEAGIMDGAKKWYQSKTIWTAVVTALIAVYNIVGTMIAPVFGFSLPIIPDWVFAFLGALGIYSRVAADKLIR